MLNAIAGVWPIDVGSIVIDGVDMTGLSEHKESTVSWQSFQDPMNGTAATMEIIENLALAARRGQKRGASDGESQKSEKKNTERCLQNLTLVLRTE